jgi:hypothetical protein
MKEKVRISWRNSSKFCDVAQGSAGKEKADDERNLPGWLVRLAVSLQLLSKIALLQLEPHNSPPRSQPRPMLPLITPQRQHSSRFHLRKLS